MRAVKYTWAGLFAVAMVGTMAGTAHAEPLKIRGSWVAPVSNWASIWLEKKDLATHFGKSYVFESVRYAGTPPMITAMATSELEIGDLAYSTLPIAIGNAGMDDLRVVADEFQDGYPGYRNDEFQVLADGPIKKVEDLKGKVLTTNRRFQKLGHGRMVFLFFQTMLHSWDEDYFLRDRGYWGEAG